VDVQAVQPDLAQVYGQIEILLVAGQSVEQQDGRARAIRGGQVQASKELDASGLDEGGFQPRADHGPVIATERAIRV
jgi:hypothetical protein